MCLIASQILHNYNTRSVRSLVLPNTGSHGQKSFKYFGARYWNSLPNEVRNCEKKDTLKSMKLCKEFLLSAMSAKENKNFLF